MERRIFKCIYTQIIKVACGKNIQLQNNLVKENINDSIEYYEKKVLSYKNLNYLISVFDVNSTL